MNPSEIFLTVALSLMSCGVLYLAFANAWLRQKNEAQRQLLETPAPAKPKRIPPSRIVVRLKGAPNEIVYGWKFCYPEGRLVITDDNDLVAAAFGPGKWISAVVVGEPQEAKTPAPKPTEEPKPKEAA
jgi:hypothetical protein